VNVKSNLKSRAENISLSSGMMELAPFLLDQWLEQKFTADPPVEFDLGASTGPVWTLRELLSLAGAGAHEALLDTRLLYTSAAGSRDLREAIAGMQGIDPSHVQVVTGAAEALWLLFFHAGRAGANVVLPKPGFPTNAALAETFGLEVRYYTLRRDTGFRIDQDEIRKLVDGRTGLVLVNSPHNPTGAVLSDAEMERLHDFCAERGVQLVCDEVYHPIYHGTPSRSAARLPHATVLGDFSKALCLSGLRVGWIVERDPERRRRYNNARSYFTASNTVLGERLAVLALEHREAIYARARRIAQANLSLLDQVFAEFSDVLRWVRPSGGMTAFPWLANGGDGREFCRRLMQRGVMLAPGDCFGMPAHFRLGFAASGEKFAAGVERLAEVLRGDGLPVGRSKVGHA
jgi:aspartate/methionine/tyrosine aminotransferase